MSYELEFMLLGCQLGYKIQMCKVRVQSLEWMEWAYSVAMELGHDGLHCLLVLFQKLTELPIFLMQSMILYDNLSVCTFELGLQSFCGTRTSVIRLCTYKYRTDLWKYQH